MDIKKPKRTFEMQINIGGDEISNILDCLSDIEFNLLTFQKENNNDIPFNKDRIFSIINGSSRSSYDFKLKKTNTKNHEHYHEQLKEYLLQLEKE